MIRVSAPLLIGISLLPWSGTLAQEGKELSVEELTRQTMESVVVVHHQGRRADEGATGAGFIIEPDGLIATNWHVINEGRRIEVELKDGTRHEVTEIHAWDRKMDLALIRIEPDEELPHLDLGDSDSLVQGQSMVALGNPRGLNFSVVEGVISGFREIGEDPYPLIQVAMPVEEGNSGGPLLDRQGLVQGIISLKSLVTPNLGFARPVNALRILLEQPNPMPMDRWATIGALEPRMWTPVMGADWSQRAGRITVKGPGDGFGGRSLCLSAHEPDTKAFDLEVEVRLNDESGAAGLAFASDGEDVHYGFYPSGGQLRLTRFEGPDVYSWTILEQVQANAYRPGEWNRIRVRLDDSGIECWVNGELAIQSEDTSLRGGKVGLCNFRETEAEFRNFRHGENLEEEAVDNQLLTSLTTQVDEWLRTEGNERMDIIDSLTSRPAEARATLQGMNRTLQARLETLRQLTRDANAEIVAGELKEALKEENADLLRACLLISRLDNDELDVDSYLRLVDQMSREIREALPEGVTEEQRIAEVRKWMFEENGFHGSRLDYYHPSNSYINEVLDDREGIPITLSVVFMELARRAGSESIHGVGLPGHFVLGYRPAPDELQLVDVFQSGEDLSFEDAALMIFESRQASLPEEMLEPVEARQIVVRMLHNLVNARKQNGAPLKALPYLHVILALSPEDAAARLDRALMRFQEGDEDGTRSDLRWLLENEPPGMNLTRIRTFYERL